MTLRVCIDISAALAQSAGIGRYTRELALALQTLAASEDLSLSLLHNRQPLEHLPATLAGLPRSEIPLNNKAWRAWALAGLPLPKGWTSTLRNAHIFHGADAVTPRIAQPAIITIHDLTTLLFGQFHTRSNRLYQRIALPVMARRAKTIITDSESTRQDVIAHLQVEAQKVHTVHLGIDHRRFTLRPHAEAQERMRSAHALTRPYILSLGTLEPRKNLLTLLDAFVQLPGDRPQLVLAGKPGWDNNALVQQVEAMGLGQDVRLLGFVADALLPDLYAAAEVFVYPSLYEGFGLPPLEAMACGVPVIASNRSSLPEVCGDAALLVDPVDTQGLAKALESVLQSPRLQLELRTKGVAQAARFQWATTARKTLAIYRETGLASQSRHKS